MINRSPAKDDCLSPINKNEHHIIPIPNADQSSNDSIDLILKYRFKLLPMLVMASIGFIVMLCLTSNTKQLNKDEIPIHSNVNDRYLLTNGNDSTVPTPLSPLSLSDSFTYEDKSTSAAQSSITNSSLRRSPSAKSNKKKIIKGWTSTAPTATDVAFVRFNEEVMNRALYELESYWFMLIFNNFCLEERNELLRIDTGKAAAQYLEKTDWLSRYKNQIKRENKNGLSQLQIVKDKANEFNNYKSILKSIISDYIDNQMLEVIYGEEKKQSRLNDPQWNGASFDLKMQSILVSMANCV